MTFFRAAARAGGLAAALFAAAGAAGPSAADDSVFRIAGVAVDATAENANAAREIAIAQGHALAFRRLVDRIVRTADARNVPRLGHAEVAPMVRGFEVADEKTSRVRYLARLSFQFDRDSVRRFLRSIDIAFAETRGRPTLVLPVLRSAGVYLLWDTPNPWREVWSNLPETGDLVPLIMPLGDLRDVRDIGAAQAARGNPSRLRAIAERYDAAEVAVAVAALSRGFDRRALVQVTVSRYGDNADDRTIVGSYRAAAAETVDQLVRSAARQTARQLQEAWKARHLLRFDRENRLEAVVPIAGLAQWVRISRALTEIPSIEQSRILSLSRGQARVRLRYYGDRRQLDGALARADLRLSRRDGGWVLRSARRGADDGGAPPAPHGIAVVNNQEAEEAKPE